MSHCREHGWQDASPPWIRPTEHLHSLKQVGQVSAWAPVEVSEVVGSQSEQASHRGLPRCACPDAVVGHVIFQIFIVVGGRHDPVPHECPPETRQPLPFWLRPSIPLHEERLSVWKMTHRDQPQWYRVRNQMKSSHACQRSQPTHSRHHASQNSHVDLPTRRNSFLTRWLRTRLANQFEQGTPPAPRV